MKLHGKGRCAAIVVFAALLHPGVLGAQDARPYIGVGYVASAPDLFGGGAIYGVLPDVLGGIGLYVDAKFDLDRPTEDRGFVSGVTAEDVEATRVDDQYIRSDDVWYSVNVAVVRPVSQGLSFYVGAGYSEMKRYSRYDDVGVYDPLGFGGLYWVEEAEAATTTMNLLAGVFFRMTDSVSAQFGYERSPSGFTVGVSYRFPF